MKNILLFVSVFVPFCICFPAKAQDSMISLFELNASGKKKLPVPANDIAIVDLNSSISLQLHLAQIETEILKFQGLSSTDSRLIRLEMLNKMLEAEVAITNYINAGFKRTGATPEAQLAYFRGLNELGIELLDAVESDTTLYFELTSPETDQASNAFEGSYPEFILYFLNQKLFVLRSQ